MTADPAIWTLEARGSVLLDVLVDYFDLSNKQVRALIVSAHRELVDVLSAKGIDYSKLKAALVPKADRLERAFIFDSALIESNWYGYDVAEKLVPLLQRETTCSILVGDLIQDDQDLAFEVLQRYLRLHRPHEIAHTSQLYCIYVNNLSPTMAERIQRGLRSYHPYVGFADVTFSSPMKNWLSTILVNCYIKAAGVFLGAHEDDVPSDEDYNLPGWPVEDYSYSVRSVQSTYYDLLLTYKIERAVFPGFERDTRFALGAISDNPQDLSTFSVQVQDAKLAYLRSEKGESLKRAGIDDMTRPELEELIRSRVQKNYIYNLRFDEEHDASLFNIVLEVVNPSDRKPFKLTAAMEYIPKNRALRVVTFF